MACRTACEGLFLPVHLGPHYVAVSTALSNIRMTTFFAGESEAKIVDPSRIHEVSPFGCDVQFIAPTEPGGDTAPELPC